MKTKNFTWIISSLILVILILVGIVIYFLAVKPSFSEYITEKQVEAYNLGVQSTINSILGDLNQVGYTQITIGNQSLYLTSFNPQALAQ